jgi:hypothetical protein
MRLQLQPTTLRTKVNRYSPTAAKQPATTTSSNTVIKYFGFSLIDRLNELDLFNHMQRDSRCLHAL